MAVPLCMKRMARERANLEKPNDDYFVVFNDDDNLRTFHAYVIGPRDTLYEHKFVKLGFEIPDRYPLVPPKCTFIQHGGARIHPNLYVEGKVCLSILGTWAGEPWALAMTIETVLITVRSLLDNEPYKHEPGQSDHPQFNAYVQYGTWTWLLLDYLKHEQNEKAKVFLQKHVSLNAAKIMHDLRTQHANNKGTTHFNSPYAGSNRYGLVANYEKLTQDVFATVEACCEAQAERDAKALPMTLSVSSPNDGTMQQDKVMQSRVTEIADLDEPDPVLEQRNASVVGMTDARVSKGSKPCVKNDFEVIDLT